MLLVFPIKNAKEPRSLWSELFPRSKMKWEWDDNGDNRVAKLWHLMKRLSDCREVIYSKWYQGRATFFSIELFKALLNFSNSIDSSTHLSHTALQVLEVLEADSPLSTKELKKMAGLQGKLNEGTYSRSTKELFRNFAIVAFGEVDDGAFPSLCLGATKLLYEDIWNEARAMTLEEATAIVDQFMPRGSLGRKYLERVSKFPSPSSFK